MTAQSHLYCGQVYHRRVRPTVHELRYRVFSFFLDLDAIDSVAEQCRLFSRNRFNVFSFRDTDFGLRPDEPLRSFVERRLIESGINQKPATIRLLCTPRMLGYTFNPLSVYYCFDAGNRLFATLHEVHNTFHERHSYALPAVPDDNENGWVRQSCDKAMYVSPFVPDEMRYGFRLNTPGERLVLVIHVSDQNGLMVNAALTAKQVPLTDRTLLRCLVAYPLLTLKVTAGIHYEAMKLWFKRVPWYSHRAQNRV
ncbi:MAG: DUF1365 family protein [Gammaproteobacteria bacterium]|nr:DUF1365 family protein [Gammaproteobacteria bacterium]